MSIRDEKMKEVITRSAAEFFERESNRDAMITVTNVTLSSDFKYAKIFLSIFPTDKEKAVMDFAMRMRSELHDYIKEHVRSRVAPHIEVALDLGEKNRQIIEGLSIK